MSNLTPRQRQILQLAACGASNDEIAQALGIARPTVKNHMFAVSKIYGTKTRVQSVITGLAFGDIEWIVAWRGVDARREK